MRWWNIWPFPFGLSWAYGLFGEESCRLSQITRKKLSRAFHIPKPPNFQIMFVTPFSFFMPLLLSLILHVFWFVMCLGNEKVVFLLLKPMRVSYLLNHRLFTSSPTKYFSSFLCMHALPVFWSHLCIITWKIDLLFGFALGYVTCICLISGKFF